MIYRHAWQRCMHDSIHVFMQVQRVITETQELKDLRDPRETRDQKEIKDIREMMANQDNLVRLVLQARMATKG